MPELKDKEINELCKEEAIRQNNGIELIASENYPSVDVREASSSIFIAKYAEGYPSHRCYGGCEYVDKMESLTMQRAEKLFNCLYANVQPHSGSQANFAAYHVFLKPGDKVLALSFADGGHMTHGSMDSFSGNTYNFSFYPLDPKGKLDYDLICQCLDEVNPNLFLAGYSAYPYAIDFRRLREIIDKHNKKAKVHAYFMVDMAHIAGIVAAGLCQNPVKYADIVTSTTHKTLRGPRGGIILTDHQEYIDKINSSVFPYTQGGPLEHTIAAKGVCFLEDLMPSFKEYISNVLKNTSVADEELRKRGAVVSGTENHMFLVNVYKSFGISGREAEKSLESIGISTNKDLIHGDTLSPEETSGLRIGFAAATTRGCTIEDAKAIADLTYDFLSDKDKKDLSSYKARVREITSRWKNVMTIRHLN